MREEETAKSVERRGERREARRERAESRGKRLESGEERGKRKEEKAESFIRQTRVADAERLTPASDWRDRRLSPLLGGATESER
jgi:hypothetical protein